MGDVNLEIKLSNLDERVIKIEETGGGSGGSDYITSVSNDFNVVNKKLSLSNDITTKLSKVDNKIDKPTSATEGQVLTYRNNEWVADDSQGGSQYVIIAKGKAYEGQTVTATKGTKSKSAVITSGVARILVDEGGVWTLTLSSGETYNTPNMTYYGEYEVIFVPNGSTVTPTDDVQTWLKCADLNKSYTTISQVLADTNTLSALISDNNASDYLARSTTWASDVCSNESAMTYIGLDDYCVRKLLSDSTWLEAICDSPYFKKVLTENVPTMTSDTQPEGLVIYSTPYPGLGSAYKIFSSTDNKIYWGCDGGGYVGYKFAKSITVNKMAVYPLYEGDICKFYECALEASNDNSEWTPLGTYYCDKGSLELNNTIHENSFSIANDTPYLYYRVIGKREGGSGYIFINALQFYGR